MAKNLQYWILNFLIAYGEFLGKTFLCFGMVFSFLQEPANSIGVKAKICRSTPIMNNHHIS